MSDSKEDKMISFEPMKFGTENDLKIALTELRWIRKIKGKLTKNDFEMLSEKYIFPIDFLRQAITGFSFPEDYMISKSQWFPILFSWSVVRRELSLSLFKLQFSYIRARSWSLTFLVTLGIILSQLSYSLLIIFKLDLYQMLSVIVIPFAFFFIALALQLESNIASKKMRLDEYSDSLKEKGFDDIRISNERFIMQNFKTYRNIVYAGNIILRKMQSSPQLAFFHQGMTERERTPTRLSRILVKLHLLPKSFAVIEKEKIPIFYAENSYIEYRKRIEELEKEN